MNARQFVRLLVLLFCCAMMVSLARAQVTIAQISDPHIGLARAPQGSQQLQQVVQQVNQRNPDIVVVTGDVGERESAWDEARSILKGLKAKVYYIPGNHDVHASGPGKWRSAFGEDYYKIQVKNVTIYALDSQLLGNWDDFNAKSMPQTPSDVKAEGDKMLNWLGSQGGGEDRGHGKDHDKDRDDKGRGKDKDKDRSHGEHGGDRGNVVLAMQHVPPLRDGGFPDQKPYWIVPEPNSSREIDIFKKLGIRDVLVGHWHDGRVFNGKGITWHVAPSTSWSPSGAKLGWAMHTVSGNGDVKTDFVYLNQ
jgi:3',5'-cyclic AMP phosphodiesterase CpdA